MLYNQEDFFGSGGDVENVHLGPFDRKGFIFLTSFALDCQHLR